MAEDDNKKPVASTEEIRSLLKMESGSEQPEEPGVQISGAPPADLPFMEKIEEPVKSMQTRPEFPEKISQPLGAEAPAKATGPIDQFVAPAERKGNELYGIFLWLFR